MTTTIFTDAVQILGTQNVVQLGVQGPAGQTQPLQQWLNNSATALAQITYDGRLQLGNNIISGPADALIQANYNPTGSMPTSVWHAPGTISSASQIGNPINWVFHELQLAGTAGVTSVHNALYSKLTNNNTGTATTAELRGATFEAVNQTGSAPAPVGKVTGFRGIVTNAANAFLSTAVGVEAYLSNDTGGSISQAVAFSVVPPLNNAGTIVNLYGLQIPDLTAGTTSNFAIQTGRGIVSFGDKVGIGTTNPYGKLEAIASGLYSNNEVAANGIQTSTGHTNGTDYTLYMGADSTNHLSYIQSVQWGTGPAPLALNARGGFVGIGTYNPSAVLHAVSASGGGVAVGIFENDQTSAVPEQIIIRGHSNTNQQLLLGYNTTGDYGSIQAIKQGVTVEPLVLNPASGNVGIFTTSPGQLLDLGYGHLRFTQVPAPGACTASLVASAGNVNAGTHTYKVTHVTASGETTLGTASNTVTTDAGHGQVNLTAIPTGTVGNVTSRKIYRTKAGGSSYFLLTTIADNTTATYTDNTADASLDANDATNLGNTTAGEFWLGGARAGIITGNGTALGVHSLESALYGTQNAAFGAYALQLNTSGSNNAAFGHGALTNNSSGASNTAVGAFALFQNTTSTQNTAVGTSALQNNTTGSNNTAVGVNALVNNSTAGSNTAVGTNALNVNSTGIQNTAVGTQALQNNTATNNTAVGMSALITNTTGSGNVAVGVSALYFNTTASNNTAVGFNSLNQNSTGTQNTAVGTSALFNNTTGANNTAVGLSALTSNTTGGNNIAIGVQALNSNTTVSDNVAVGYQTLFTNSTGVQNIAIGSYALYHSTTSYNVAIGFGALTASTTGTQNTAVGFQALTSNTTASYNTAVGLSALAANTTGAANAALGVWALTSNTSGAQNVAIGLSSLYANTTGINNVAIGLQAGYTATGANANTTGSQNTFVGYNTGPGTSTQINYAIAIGASALVSVSSACVIGSATAGGSVSDVNLGVGTAAPTARGHFVLNDTATNAVGDVAIFSHDSTGAIAANFGTGIRLQGQSSTTADRDMARWRTFWSTATDASRASKSVLSAFDSTGERDVIGWGANGSARTLGFYGATQVVQPATTGTSTGFTANSGTAMNSASTSTGGTGSSAYTFGDVVLALKQLGLLAA